LCRRPNLPAVDVERRWSIATRYHCSHASACGRSPRPGAEALPRSTVISSAPSFGVRGSTCPRTVLRFAHTRSADVMGTPASFPTIQQERQRLCRSFLSGLSRRELLAAGSTSWVSAAAHSRFAPRTRRHRTVPGSTLCGEDSSPYRKLASRTCLLMVIHAGYPQDFERSRTPRMSTRLYRLLIAASSRKRLASVASVVSADMEMGRHPAIMLRWKMQA